MKDWENISDDEFDEVFRDNTLNHEEKLWHEAWPLMQEKLEDEDRKRRFIVFWRWAAAVLIFGTLGILSIGYFRSNDLETIVSDFPQNLPKQPPHTIKKNAPTDGSEKALLSKNKQDLKSEIWPNTKTLTISSSSKISEKSLQKNQINKNNSLKLQIQNDTKSQVVLAQTEKQELPAKSKDESYLNPDAENSLTKQEPAITEPLLAQTSIESKVETKSTENYFSEDTVIVLGKQPNIVLAQNETNNLSEAKNESSGKILQKLALNLGFSPDYSKVVSDKFGPMGYNLQLLLDYKITEKLTFRGGVMKSLKLYDANPENYSWPAKWGAPSSPLKEISASCNMLDIPVSLSYNFLEKGPNKFFTTLGITNYKMLKEKYVYTYENNYDPNLKWKKWEGNTGFFGAGVANLSLGMERRLTRSLSVQLEPFVKMPLKKVGFGNVKLLSTGLFFNLKTHIPSKVQQPK